MAKSKGPKVETIAIVGIDTTIANAVRSHVREDVVDDYAERMKSGAKFPPIEVYGYSGGYVLADGTHRLKAASKCGKLVIAATVHTMPGKDEAEAAAWPRALCANVEHGLRRSNEDRWAAITAALMLPQYAEASDRSIAELCSVQHTTVRTVREKLSAQGKLKGEAHADSRGYKPKEVPAVPPQAADSDVVIKGDVQISEKAISGEIPLDIGNGEVVARPPETKVDECGRPVPEELQAVFEARTWFRQQSLAVGKLRDEFEAGSKMPHGAELNSLWTHYQGLFKDLAASLAGNMPHCVCPYYEETHPANCPLCKGRLWISRTRLQQCESSVRDRAESWRKKPS